MLSTLNFYDTKLTFIYFSVYWLKVLAVKIPESASSLSDDYIPIFCLFFSTPVDDGVFFFRFLLGGVCV